MQAKRQNKKEQVLSKLGLKRCIQPKDSGLNMEKDKTSENLKKKLKILEAKNEKDICVIFNLVHELEATKTKLERAGMESKQMKLDLDLANQQSQEVYL